MLSLRHCLHGCTYLVMLLLYVCNLTVKIFASNPTNGLISDALDKGQFVTFRSFTETQNSSRLKSKDLPCLECCSVVFECMVLSQAANLTIPRKFWPTTDTASSTRLLLFQFDFRDSANVVWVFETCTVYLLIANGFEWRSQIRCRPTGNRSWR